MSINTIDTRDLIDKRIELKEDIYNDFIDTFPRPGRKTSDYEDIPFGEERFQSWKEKWKDELEQIDEIYRIEDEIGEAFDHGVTLVDEYDWEDFVEEELDELGYIPKDFPNFIVINWRETAFNYKQDYEEIEYQNTTYYYRI